MERQENHRKSGSRKNLRFAQNDHADLIGSDIFTTESVPKPFINHANCLGDMARASLDVRGHVKRPDPPLMVSRRKPSPSQTSPLILLK